VASDEKRWPGYLLRVKDERGAGSGRFRNFARLDATGANLLTLDAALRALNADGLQVWIKATARAIVSVRDIIAELRPFAADFTTFCHKFLKTSDARLKSAKSFSSQR
jgi:hypothetical protein